MFFTKCGNNLPDAAKFCDKMIAFTFRKDGNLLVCMHLTFIMSFPKIP